jgi:predicted transcriptional regulator of viral defense system
MVPSQRSSSNRADAVGIAAVSGRYPDLRFAHVVAARYGGLLPAHALREAGVSPPRLQRLRSEGVLHSVRRGIYVAGEHWRAADANERYRLMVRATVLAVGHPPVLSHHSAAVLHGLPIIGSWPRTVHTINSEATGGNNARFTTGHRGPAPETVETIAGCQVTSLARTLVDVAATSSLLVGVTMLDHALRVEGDRPALTKETLYRELALVNPRRGRRQATQAIAFANPLSANPGETLSRVRIFQLGFEVPELQVCFPRILGGNAYVDFWWPRVRKIGEFDGLLKYRAGPVLAGRDPGSVVWQEKQREDELRARVNSFDRWGWDLALSPERFHAFLVERAVPRA